MAKGSFYDRTADLYHAMRGRFKEKRGAKTGRVTRVGRTVPFTLDEFRCWLASIFGPQVVDGFGNAVRCPYCGVPIDFLNCSIDHIVPISRGGELGLSNLCACCAECNRAKGSLTGTEFTLLLAFLAPWQEAARKDLLTRLKTGAGFVRLRFFKKNKPGAAPAATAKQFELEEEAF